METQTLDDLTYFKKKYDAVLANGGDVSKICRQIELLEDALVVYRLSKLNQHSTCQTTAPSRFVKPRRMINAIDVTIVLYIMFGIAMIYAYFNN